MKNDKTNILSALLPASMLITAFAVAAWAGASPSTGYIVAWGHNDHGQCDVPVGNDFVEIAAGWSHNLALKSDGSLVAWGQNW